MERLRVDRCEVADVHVLVTRENTGSGGLHRTLETALVPYLMQTSTRDRLRVDITQFTEDDETPDRTRRDPLDYWTIEMYADGSADFESSQKSFDTRYGVYVSRVTEAWKLQFRPFLNSNYDRFDRGDDTIERSARRDGFTSYAVRSISPHFSTGAFGDIFTSTFANVEWRYRLMAARYY